MYQKYLEHLLKYMFLGTSPRVSLGWGPKLCFPKHVTMWGWSIDPTHQCKATLWYHQYQNHLGERLLIRNIEYLSHLKVNESESLEAWCWCFHAHNYSGDFYTHQSFIITLSDHFAFLLKAKDWTSQWDDKIHSRLTSTSSSQISKHMAKKSEKN